MKKCNDSTYATAKKIKSEMTTADAGIYRLSKLTKTATIQNIKILYEAMMNTDEKKHDELWAKVFDSSLYKDKSADYTHILAHIAINYRKTEAV